MAKQYNFITEPPKSRFCPICFDLLTEPYLSDCGHHVCCQCRTRLLASNENECPECREPDMLSSARLNKFLQREINDLKICCQHCSEGCEWIGEVRDLLNHLNPKTRKCNYIYLPCFFGCGKKVQSGSMREHMISHCTKRQISCQYCFYCSSCDIVTTKHLPICLQAPVICPNNCNKEGLKRGQLQAHIDECPLQVISCPFTSAGCTVKLPRNDMEKHEDTAMRQHLRLLMKLHLNQENSNPPAATISSPFLYNQAPIELTMSNFRERKEANEVWSSPPFYTHSRGYKFCLEVHPNGDGIGRDSHISAFVTLLRGEFDDDLKWPFEGDFTFQLLNWREDRCHYSHTACFGKGSDPDGKHCFRVITKEAGKGYGKPQFVSHSKLAYDESTNTEYLLDDHLKFRVDVALYSTPLISLIPAWQDSPITTQPWTQFTISEYSKRKQFNNIYYSLPIITNPLGYKLCIKVLANGYGSGKDSHMSVYALMMKGQHDDHLQWPFTGTIIVQLLNWLEDKEHHEERIEIYGSSSNFVRVTKGDFGKSGHGHSKFITQSSLNASSSNTQYLYQDSICIRVLAIDNN